MNLQIAISSAFQTWHPDDALLVDALDAVGICAVPLVWGTPTDEPVLIRTPWDYTERLDEFLVWANQCPRLIHPAEVVHWNSDKHYLFALQAAGIPIIPTSLERKPPLGGKFVIKPSISAAARDTKVFTTWDDEAEALCERITGRGAVPLLQPFRDAVLQGEWSFVFFGGEFSHAVFKTPKAGDFRVQSDHGGSVQLRPYPQTLLADATRALDAVPFETTYARVDGLETNGRLEVMEIELIEPELFTRYVAGSAQNFARVIQQRLCDVDA